MSHEVYYIQPSLASDYSVVRCQECFLYTYTGMGVSYHNGYKDTYYLS